MDETMMLFPETVEEFMEQNKIVDTEQIYTNGTDLVPIFRMKQWFISHPCETPRWIPVTERLPEEHEEVLTSDSVFGITFDSLHNGKWRKHPVAWMPLPEPYKGGEQNG